MQCGFFKATERCKSLMKVPMGALFLMDKIRHNIFKGLNFLINYETNRQ
jgi:hypothetical protein